MNAITVRKMDFEFDQMDPVFIEGDPDRSFGMIGLSLLLPYLEPYLIRTMKVARSRSTTAARRRSGALLCPGRPSLPDAHALQRSAGPRSLPGARETRSRALRRLPTLLEDEVTAFQSRLRRGFRSADDRERAVFVPARRTRRRQRRGGRGSVRVAHGRRIRTPHSRVRRLRPRRRRLLLPAGRRSVRPVALPALRRARVASAPRSHRGAFRCGPRRRLASVTRLRVPSSSISTGSM